MGIAPVPILFRPEKMTPRTTSTASRHLAEMASRATSAVQLPRTCAARMRWASFTSYSAIHPRIHWQDGINRIPADLSNSPAIISHHREAMIYAVWPHLVRPAWVCAQIGYNFRKVTSVCRRENRGSSPGELMVNRLSDRRPIWLRDCSNMISQFDADALALII